MLSRSRNLDKCPDFDPQNLDKCIIGEKTKYVRMLVEIKRNMKKSTEKQYYLYILDDYSAPSCTSSTKSYFGTIDDFKQMLTHAGVNRLPDLQRTLEGFEKGDKNITHSVCYNPQKFAIPATVIKQKTLQYDSLGFRYKNPYGFYYLARADHTIITLYLIKSQRFYYSCYQIRVKNPKFKDDIGKGEFWADPPFWGLPGVVIVKKEKDGAVYFENTLLETERKFKMETEAMEHFDNVKKVDLTAFYEDIFGDG